MPFSETILYRHSPAVYDRVKDGPVAGIGHPSKAREEGATMNLVSKTNAVGAWLSVSVCAAALAISAPLQAATYVTVNVSGSIGTYGIAIDTNGDIAGNWYTSGYVSHGFSRTAGGILKKFDPTGSTETTVTSMNDKNRIGGYFKDSQGTHGFLRGPAGTIVVYDAPGSSEYTQILAQNGKAYGGDYGASGNDYGFVVNAQNVFTSFSVMNGRYTFVSAINAKGVAAGTYYDGSGYRCFLRKPSGWTKTFAVPGGSNPFVRGINTSGDVVGTSYHGTLSSSGHGFIRAADGTFTTFQVVSGHETQASSINDDGSVSGTYYDASGDYHSYIRASNGTITSFDPPNGVVSNALGINASGQTTGYSYDSSNIQRGYIRTP
jgi:hypothetical protein